MKLSRYSILILLLLPLSTAAIAQERGESLALPSHGMGTAAAWAADDLNHDSDSVLLLNEIYRKRIERYNRFWHGLIPSQVKLQYAGSIGLLSAGMGWHYGKQRRIWETDLMFGFLPAYDTRTSKLTMTIKQGYIPFRITLHGNWQFEPLSCGLFFNTVFGEEFWSRQPSKYPKRYYGFSTSVRSNVFVGERFRYQIPMQKRRRISSISLYYELSTNDLYLVSAIPNSYLKLGDILSLCFGIKYDFF